MQRIRIAISLKKIYKRPTNAQHQWPWGKCKLKPQCHVSPVRTAIIKKTEDNKCWCACGERGALLCCWWECKLVQPQNSMEDPQRIKNRTTTQPSNSTHGSVHKGNENDNLIDIPMYTAELFIIARYGSNLTLHPWTDKESAVHTQWHLIQPQRARKSYYSRQCRWTLKV